MIEMNQRFKLQNKITRMKLLKNKFIVLNNSHMKKADKIQIIEQTSLLA